MCIYIYIYIYINKLVTVCNICQRALSVDNSVPGVSKPAGPAAGVVCHGDANTIDLGRGNRVTSHLQVALCIFGCAQHLQVWCAVHYM